MFSWTEPKFCCTVFCLHYIPGRSSSALTWITAQINWSHLNIQPWIMPLPTARIYDPPADGSLIPPPSFCNSWVTRLLSGAYSILLNRKKGCYFILLYFIYWDDVSIKVIGGCVCAGNEDVLSLLNEMTVWFLCFLSRSLAARWKSIRNQNIHRNNSWF